MEQIGTIEYTRSRDFFDPADHPHAHVTIVGCGGIGSFTAHALAKLGIPSLTLVDFDVVEPHNIPNQLYTKDDVGEYKVVALQDQLLDTTNAQVESVPYRLTEQGWENATDWAIGLPMMSGIIISALDSMYARQLLWEQVRMKYPVNLFIDGRLGGQNIVVYTASPVSLDDIAGYEATLHGDDEGLDMPCTGRNVIDVGYAMAAVITRHVRTYLINEDVPKVTYQDQESMFLSTSGWLL